MAASCTRREWWTGNTFLVVSTLGKVIFRTASPNVPLLPPSCNTPTQLLLAWLVRVINAGLVTRTRGSAKDNATAHSSSLSSIHLIDGLPIEETTERSSLYHLLVNYGGEALRRGTLDNATAARDVLCGESVWGITPLEERMRPSCLEFLQGSRGLLRCLPCELTETQSQDTALLTCLRSWAGHGCVTIAGSQDGQKKSLFIIKHFFGSVSYSPSSFFFANAAPCALPAVLHLLSHSVHSTWLGIPPVIEPRVPSRGRAAMSERISQGNGYVSFGEGESVGGKGRAVSQRVGVDTQSWDSEAWRIFNQSTSTRAEAYVRDLTDTIKESRLQVVYCIKPILTSTPRDNKTDLAAVCFQLRSLGVLTVGGRITATI